MRSAYDYYPFGMLMPGRYVSDTSQHCVTVTQPTWGWKEVTVACWDVYAWVWPGYTRTGEGTAVVDGDAVKINAPNATDAVSFDFPVTPNVQQELNLDIKQVSLNDKASVQIMEQQGENWVTLAQSPINVVSGGMTIPFRPTGSSIRVVWHGKILVWVRHDCISKLEWVEEDQLVTICDGDKDKYRWGYNGQEKVNEWAGLGNFNEFKERGQDSRIGRFLSVDPLSQKFPYLTPYQFASNSPIQAVDMDGLEGIKYTDATKKQITVVVDIDYIPRGEGEKSNYTFSEKEIDRVKKNLFKEINKHHFKDQKTGYDVLFKINFKSIDVKEVSQLQSNNDIMNPDIFLSKMRSQSETRIATDKSTGEEIRETRVTEAGAQWRSLKISNTRDGHSIAHELFHNLIHVHLNAPKDLKNQIDPEHQEAGHKEAGGIFIYEDSAKGTHEKDINQKNIQDVLRTVPEANKN